jgi:hypothetical protein
LPPGRAWLKPDGGLTIRPAHFPIQNGSSLTVETIETFDRDHQETLCERVVGG